MTTTTRSARRAGPVARRYARAWFAVARESGSLDSVRADAALLNAVFADAHAVAAIEDPRLDDRRKRAMVEKAFGEMLHAHTRALLGVLERRRRLALLAEIPGAFSDLDDAHAGRVRGVLETALPLAEEARQRIERALSRRTGRQVLLAATTNPALLGGVRVTFGGTRLDASASGRIEVLKQRLLAVELR
jgi:ATP synthase F1 delta subunit